MVTRALAQNQVEPVQFGSVSQNIPSHSGFCTHYTLCIFTRIPFPFGGTLSWKAWIKHSYRNCEKYVWNPDTPIVRFCTTFAEQRPHWRQRLNSSHCHPSDKGHCQAEAGTTGCATRCGLDTCESVVHVSSSVAQTWSPHTNDETQTNMDGTRGVAFCTKAEESKTGSWSSWVLLNHAVMGSPVPEPHATCPTSLWSSIQFYVTENDPGRGRSQGCRVKNSNSPPQPRAPHLKPDPGPVTEASANCVISLWVEHVVSVRLS